MAKYSKPPKMTVIPATKTVPKEEISRELQEMKSPPIERTYDPRPEFELSGDDFPEIKNWKTGEEYMVDVKILQTGSRICDYGDKKGQMIGTFKIIGIANDEEEESEFPKGMTVKKK